MTQEKSLNEKIEQILAQEDSIAQRKSWKGRLTHIWHSDDRKRATILRQRTPDLLVA